MLALAVGAFASPPEGAKCFVTYTFDDGLLDQYTCAYPMLRERKLPATFFIIGAKIGNPNGMKSKAERNTPTMTWEMLVDMSTNGMEIASHGWAHAKYSKMDRSAVLDDIRHNQSVLKERVHVDCVSFAAPYNIKTTADGDSIDKIAQEAGIVAMRLRQKAAGGKMTAEKMNALVAEARDKGEWIVFMTHGMERGYDAWENAGEFAKHLDWVKTQGDVWVATFADAFRNRDFLTAQGGTTHK